MINVGVVRMDLVCGVIEDEWMIVGVFGILVVMLDG